MSTNRGRIALVSGGNRGIGLAVVEGLVPAGLIVVLGARDAAAGEAARARLSAPSDSVHVVQLDVSNGESVDRCIATIERELGHLDVLINNAGVVLDEHSRATDPDLALVEETLATNLFGAWALSHRSLSLLRRSGDGRIINVSSGMGQLSDMGGGSPGYRLSKAGLNALTRMLASELAGQVSVNSVCPGWVRTDMGGPGATRTPIHGADTIVWLATLPSGESPTGMFFRDRNQIPW
jgi:NAD(P)-dependent dehydrogenase (short-subunit alcohol dehydrogenase family)